MVNTQVPSIFKIKQEVITTLNAARSVEISLFFTVILKHIHAFLMAWHEFKNCVTEETVLLHSQLFTVSYFHLCVTVELEITG